MRLQTLYEGLSPILFHSTSVKSAEMILKSNEFRLSTDLGSDFESTFREGNRFYFLSTSRSKVGRFQERMAITFVLDGRKLGHNYKGKAIDFFTSDERKINPRSFEHEDRVFSTNPTIPNASKYIREMHIKIDDTAFTSTRNSIVRKIILQAKKRKIPYYLYDDPKAFMLQNKKKSIDISNINLSGTTTVTTIPQSTFDRTESQMKTVLELYHKRATKELSKNVEVEMAYMFNAGFGADQEMATVIHNARTGGYKGKSRQLIEKITTIMKKERVTSIRDLYDLLKVKWEKIKRIEKEMNRPS